MHGPKRLKTRSSSTDVHMVGNYYTTVSKDKTDCRRVESLLKLKTSPAPCLNSQHKLGSCATDRDRYTPMLEIGKSIRLLSQPLTDGFYSPNTQPNRRDNAA